MDFVNDFPYTNFHDLNLDWIIKIAKDFLDQYTHIQETIANGETSLQNLTTEGLAQLQEKADTLEALLQEWYNTHSNDIALELAHALGEIATTLSSAISNFNTSADQKAVETIATIPDDYTTVATEVLNLMKLIDMSNPATSGSGAYNPNNGYEGSDYPAGTFGNYKHTFNVASLQNKAIYLVGSETGYVMQFNGTPDPSTYIANSKYNTNHGTITKIVIDNTATVLTVNEYTSAIPCLMAVDNLVTKDNNTSIQNIKDALMLKENIVDETGAYNPNNGYEGLVLPAGTFGNKRYMFDIENIPANLTIQCIGGEIGYVMQFNGTPDPSTYLTKSNANRVNQFKVSKRSGAKYFTVNEFSNTVPFIFVTDNTIGTIKGIPFITYGDSITAQGRWQPYLQMLTGLGEHTNLGVSATCLANVGSDSMVSSSRILGIPTDTQLIIVMGGTNDFAQNVPLGTGEPGSDGWDTTTFKGAVAYLIYAIQQRLSASAKIYFATPVGGNSDSSTGTRTTLLKNSLNLTMHDYSEAMKKICELYGAKCIDVYGESGIGIFNRDKYLADQVHPNDAGGRKIAELFASVISSDFRIK